LAALQQQNRHNYDTQPNFGSLMESLESEATAEPEFAKPAIKPSGPAQIVNQPARSAFILKVGEDTIFSATVKVQREDTALSFKEAGARLFVLSRSDGWDTVHQTIRVAGIGLLEPDSLVIKATVYGSGLRLVADINALQCSEGGETSFRGVHCVDADWMISVDDPSIGVILKVKPDGAVQFSATAHEITLSYRPCVTASASAK
jgi:hypothetical protein